MSPFTRAITASTIAALASTCATHAQLTLLPAGPQIGTHAGNLVTNGSFESFGPGATLRFWATGTTSTPFGVPPGWTSSGSANNYARWGRDSAVPPPRTAGSDILPDGGNALYFGNGQGATTTLAPTFNLSGEVTFAGTPVISSPLPNFPTPVILTQTVPTHLTPAPSYILSFWVSGESASSGGGSGNADGIFGLRVTNTAAADPLRYFVVPGGNPVTFGASKRLEFSFTPLNPLLPVTLEFTNWGHFNLNPFGMGGTTELVLDDVIVNAVPTPGAATALILAGCFSRRRRR